MVCLLQMLFPAGDRIPSASSAALILKMLIPDKYIANIRQTTAASSCTATNSAWLGKYGLRISALTGVVESGVV